MQQFFPVMDRIKTQIDNEDFEAATRQANLFKTQLGEIQSDAAKSEGKVANAGKTEATASSETPRAPISDESLKARGMTPAKSGSSFILPMGRPADPKHGSGAKNSENEAD
jgi:hypothetical protein